MKFDLYIEVDNKKVRHKDIMEKVKEDWKASGNLIKDLKTAALYYKPQEDKIYYIANETEKGSVAV